MTDLAAAVVGAGIAGLAFATEAEDDGELLLFDAADRPGGQIRSEQVGGYLCESAVASFLLPTPGMSTLIAQTGASAELVAALPGSRTRSIHFGDTGLTAVPASPPAAVRTNLLSAWAKLGALAEPLVRSRTPPDGTESVAGFLRRRFGAEVAARLAAPVVAGVFAGDAEETSVAAAFPALVELEAVGGILRGGLRRRKIAARARAPRATLQSFTAGMEALPRRLAQRHADRLRLGVPVETLEPVPGGWHVGSGATTLSASRVVLSCSPLVAAELLGPLDAELATLLAGFPSAPVGVVHLAYPEAAMAGHTGFGFLAHPSGGLRILGAVFDGLLFPGRAPEGEVLVRVIAGGATGRDLLAAGDDELVAAAVEDLDKVLGTGAPVFTHVVRHPAGIPQYALDHVARLSAVVERLAAMPGIDLCGWAYRGIGVNAVVADAIRLARPAASTTR